jgi:hypothetical protein
MKNISDPELIVELKNFQSGITDLINFQIWIGTKYDHLRSLIPPGILLKLRRGTEEQVMKAIASLLPPCAVCGEICSEGNFLTRQNYLECMPRIEQSIRNGLLVQIPRPRWFHAGDKHFGADGYFKCTACNAIWTFVMPEREDNGLWERLA